MATTVGTESTMSKLVENLLYLEHDAIAAYDTTIERLSDPEAKRRVAEFRGDHEQHVATLNEMARELNLQPPTRGDMKQVLTTGKVTLASLAGDGAILKAMKTNEDDTVTAYERAADHPEAIDRSKSFFAKALNDELRHRTWMSEYSRTKAA